MKKRTTRERIVGYSVLCVVALTTLLPFYFMTVMGTHADENLFTGLKLWFGDQFAVNFQKLLNSNYFCWFGNSLVIAVPATLLTLITSSMGGYALAKYDFKGRKFLVNFVFVTLMLPGSLGTVAWVWEMKQFDWINTYWPFIIPAVGNTYAVYWFMNVTKGAVSKEILESARIDGAGELRIFAQIAVPHLVPGAISLGLMNFVGCWNSYLAPAMIIKNPELYTVPVGIATMGSTFRSEYSTQILGLTIATLPLILVFACTSKYFIAGITGGSVKG